MDKKVVKNILIIFGVLVLLIAIYYGIMFAVRSKATSDIIDDTKAKTCCVNAGGLLEKDNQCSNIQDEKFYSECMGK